MDALRICSYASAINYKLQMLQRNEEQNQLLIKFMLQFAKINAIIKLLRM